MLRKWSIRRYYRSAYRPNGNGIIEHHRTIRSINEIACSLCSIVRESISTVKEVICHLNRFALLAKPPESSDGSAGLGITLKKDKENLIFKRGNVVPKFSDELF